MPSCWWSTTAPCRTEPRQSSRAIPSNKGENALCSVHGDGAEARRVEGAEIHRGGGALGDQLGQGETGGGRIQHAPGAVAGCHVGAGHSRDAPDERQAVVGDGTIASLPLQDGRGGQGGGDASGRARKNRARSVV